MVPTKLIVHCNFFIVYVRHLSSQKLILFKDNFFNLMT